MDIGLQAMGSKRPLKGVRNTNTKKVLLSRAKFAQKPFFLRGDFSPFFSESFQIWDHFFPLLFPKDSKSLKTLDIRLLEVGTKRCLNGTSKANRRTIRQTDTRTNILTYRNHRPRGPMLWKNFQSNKWRWQWPWVCSGSSPPGTQGALAWSGLQI